MTMMNWAQLMSTTRFLVNEQGNVNIVQPKLHSQPQSDHYRTPFHIDYDRLVFSNAFRRLGRKTQVHPLAKNDHTHNRLTHSVEVASVGRSLGRKIGGMLVQQGRLPPNLTIDDFGICVQVACLAHDLGNPPFGHVGEDALRQWFRDPKNAHYLADLSLAQRADIQTYEGNAHSLRQIASLEMYAQQGGMRLTASAVGSLLKYPWTSCHPDYGSHKFNIYQTELDYIQHIAQHLGLIEKSQHCWARHPLSYLMEAADDICYALMDLEDAIELNLLDEATVMDILQPLNNPSKHYQHYHPRERIAMMRGNAIGQAIEQISQTFMENETKLLNGELADKIDLLSLANADVRQTLNNAKQLAREQVFSHRSKLMYELAAFKSFTIVLDLLVPAVYQQLKFGEINHEQRLALNLLAPIQFRQGDDLYLAYMRILDYLGGMTDNYIAQIARELSGVDLR